MTDPPAGDEGGRRSSTQPPVEEVRRGLWSIPVPIPDNPLGYTLVYLFESERGPVLVDTGWNDDATWEALCAGYRHTGHRVEDTFGMLITHAHPDHHGLSARVREASGGWIALHQQDADLLEHRRRYDDDWILQMAAICLDAGASEEDVEALPGRAELAGRIPEAAPDRHLVDGELAEVPGWNVRAIWTPGHSPGHVCLVEEDVGVMLSGDHVLPEITPHIGLYSMRDDDSFDSRDGDPLGDFLASLDRVDAHRHVREVLPAHQHRFPGLGRRTAVLRAHHRSRLEAIERSLSGGPQTAWSITAAMPWNRAWDELGGLMKRTALSEAFAHLRYLERRGRVEHVPSTEPLTFQLTSAAAAEMEALGDEHARARSSTAAAGDERRAR